MADDESEQAAVIAFLAAPGTLAAGVTAERLETHGAHVFLAGDHAFKIKRAVRHSYMDFSTLALRRRALERELEINRGSAPEIYLDLMAITREAGGSLALGGAGVPVEWALRMRRFEQTSLFSHLASKGLPAETLNALGDEVHRSHAAAPVAPGSGTLARLLGVIDQITGGLGEAPDLAATLEGFRAAATRQVQQHGALIERRAAAGMVRRCHGDLHLENIVLWHGRPTLFDAIEFDEDLATVDTLYDLAFLLMDLEQRAGRPAANLVLNRYLWRSQSMFDLEGLALLPPFLALRAGVRAMVCLQRARLASAETRRGLERSGRSYLDAAIAYLEPPAARLIAVGGFSGTGKSTLARALGPRLGPAPGAVHLRSDLERKALHGVDELQRLPASAYSAAEGRRVYEALSCKARAALAAGHAVIADAVFSTPEERAAIEAVAREQHIAFDGLWLTASAAVLAGRIARRTNDASDATADVLHAQVQRGTGHMTWREIDASGDAAATLATAERALAVSRTR